MPLFYAYLKNRDDDRTWRYMLTFSSREVADEWWRVVSSAPSPWVNNVMRTAPQFYTHVTSPVHISNFFTRTDFPAARQFLDKMFFTLLNDRDSRVISIAPPSDFTDHVSGDWFYIRSQSDSSRYWYSPSADGLHCSVCSGFCNRIHVSTLRRTRFRVQARDSTLPAGAIMIGTDVVAVSTSDDSFVEIKDGHLVMGKLPGHLLFGDFRSAFKAIGVSSIHENASVIREDVIRVADSGEIWELV